MVPTSVEIRELKSHLRTYIRRVRAGETIIIADGHKTIAKIIPIEESPRARIQLMVQAGLCVWSGHKLRPRKPLAHVRGITTVANQLIEDRD